MGYKMDGLGEKLKNIEPSDFASLQDVWDGYKVRSRIAHEGANFKISRRSQVRLGQIRKRPEGVEISVKIIYIRTA